ncbi:tetratricopeptide repeat protein [Lapidilactobacillus salsurivasis]
MNRHRWLHRYASISLLLIAFVGLSACRQQTKTTLYQQSLDQGAAALAANKIAQAQDHFEDALKEVPRDQQAQRLLTQTNDYLAAQKAFNRGDLKQAAAKLAQLGNEQDLDTSLKTAFAELRQAVQAAERETGTVTNQVAQVQKSYDDGDYQQANLLLTQMDTIDWRNKPYLAQLHTQYSDLGRLVLQKLLAQNPAGTVVSAEKQADQQAPQTNQSAAGDDQEATADAESGADTNVESSDSTTALPTDPPESDDSSTADTPQPTATYYRQMLVRLMGYQVSTVAAIPDQIITAAFVQAQSQTGDARIAATILEASYPQLVLERQQHQNTGTQLTTAAAQQLAQKYWNQADTLAQQDCEPRTTTVNEETGTVTVHFAGIGEANYTYTIDFTASGQINWQDSAGNLRVLGVWK